jgi:hypothetical protein
MSSKRLAPVCLLAQRALEHLTSGIARQGLFVQRHVLGNLEVGDPLADVGDRTY